MSCYVIHPDVIALVYEEKDTSVFFYILSKFCSNEHEHRIVIDKTKKLIDKYIGLRDSDILREWFTFLMLDPDNVLYINEYPESITDNDLVLDLAINTLSKKVITSTYTNSLDIASRSPDVKVLDIKTAKKDLKITRVRVGDHSNVALDNSQIAVGTAIVQSK